MMKLRQFLYGIISQVNTDWRIKRKEKKDQDLMTETGINTEKWVIPKLQNNFIIELGSHDQHMSNICQQIKSSKITKSQGVFESIHP